MYDSTTANPVNPQGTAGGGNVFNVGSLFGDSSGKAGAYGSGGAATTSTDTAASTGGTAIPQVNTPDVSGGAAGAFGALFSNPTALIVIAVVGLVVIFGGVFLLIRKRK